MTHRLRRDMLLWTAVPAESNGRPIHRHVETAFVHCDSSGYGWDFNPYLARARNHAEAIEKAFRFRLAFLLRLNEVKRVHGDQGGSEADGRRSSGVRRRTNDGVRSPGPVHAWGSPLRAMPAP
eukprot:jgi/Tetstr1/466623/TSEL_011111.t1